MAIFQDGGRRHLGFFNFQYFNWSEWPRWPNCITVPNLVVISQIIAEIWQFFIFSKIAAVRHLGCGYVMHMFGPPKKGIWWSLSMCKV